MRVAAPELAARQVKVPVQPGSFGFGRGLPTVKTSNQPLAPPPPTPPALKARPRAPLPPPPSQPSGLAADLLTFANNERVRPGGADAQNDSGLLPRSRQHQQASVEDDLPSSLDGSESGSYTEGSYTSDSQSDYSTDDSLLQRQAGAGYAPPPTREEREKERQKKMLQRVKTISWLQRKQRTAEIPFDFDLNAPTSELLYIKSKLQFDGSANATVKVYRRILMGVVAVATQFSNYMKWQNFDLHKFDETFAMQISEYDDLLFEIYDKYGGEEQMDPLLMLSLSVGSQMVQYSMQQTLTKKFVEHVGQGLNRGAQTPAAPTPVQQQPPARHHQQHQPVAQPRPLQPPAAGSYRTPVGAPPSVASQSQPPPARPMPPPVISEPPPLPPNAPPPSGIPVLARPAMHRTLPRPPQNPVVTRPPFAAPPAAVHTESGGVLSPATPLPQPPSQQPQIPPLVVVTPKDAVADVERKTPRRDAAAAPTSPRSPPGSDTPVRSISMGSPNTPITIAMNPPAHAGSRFVRPPA